MEKILPPSEMLPRGSEVKEGVSRNVDFMVGRVKCELRIIKGKSPNIWVVEEYRLTNDKGASKSLMEYLPAGWSVFLDDDLKSRVGRIRISTQEIVLPNRFIDEPETLVAFFHELVHVHHPNNQDLPEEPWARSSAMYLRDREWKVVPEERDSWAFCIRQLKHLKSQGFEFGDILRRERLQKIVDDALRSYRDPRKLSDGEKNFLS